MDKASKLMGEGVAKPTDFNLLVGASSWAVSAALPGVSHGSSRKNPACRSPILFSARSRPECLPMASAAFVSEHLPRKLTATPRVTLFEKYPV